MSLTDALSGFEFTEPIIEEDASAKLLKARDEEDVRKAKEAAELKRQAESTAAMTAAARKASEQPQSQTSGATDQGSAQSDSSKKKDEFDWKKEKQKASKVKTVEKVRKVEKVAESATKVSRMSKAKNALSAVSKFAKTSRVFSVGGRMALRGGLRMIAPALGPFGIALVAADVGWMAYEKYSEYKANKAEETTKAVAVEKKDMVDVLNDHKPGMEDKTLSQLDGLFAKDPNFKKYCEEALKNPAEKEKLLVAVNERLHDENGTDEKMTEEQLDGELHELVVRHDAVNGLTDTQEKVMGLEHQLSNNNIELVSDAETLKAVAASGPMVPTEEQRAAICRMDLQSVEQTLRSDSRMKVAHELVTDVEVASGAPRLSSLEDVRQTYAAVKDKLDEKCGLKAEAELASVTAQLNSSTPTESLNAIFKDVGASKSDVKPASFSR